MIKDIIQNALRREHITQKQLAEQLGIGKEYLCRLISGKKTFTTGMLLEISSILNIPKEDLELYDINELLHKNKLLKGEIEELKGELNTLKTVIKHLIKLNNEDK